MMEPSNQALAAIHAFIAIRASGPSIVVGAGMVLVTAALFGRLTVEIREGALRFHFGR